ncbi:MAG TPA: S24 family peptidase [Pyrinomonadaceae bacterium]
MRSSLTAIAAGPPLPADTGQEGFDVESYLIEHRKASFYIQVNGDSMTGQGVNDGDILVVDKSIQPRHGSIVVAQVDGGFTIKTYDCAGGRLRLVPANPAYSALESSEDCSLCGVATFVIHRL